MKINHNIFTSPYQYFFYKLYFDYDKRDNNRNALGLIVLHQIFLLPSIENLAVILFPDLVNVFYVLITPILQTFISAFGESVGGIVFFAVCLVALFSINYTIYAKEKRKEKIFSKFNPETTFQKVIGIVWIISFFILTFIIMAYSIKLRY